MKRVVDLLPAIVFLLVWKSPPRACAPVHLYTFLQGEISLLVPTLTRTWSIRRHCSTVRRHHALAYKLLIDHLGSGKIGTWTARAEACLSLPGIALFTSHTFCVSCQNLISTSHILREQCRVCSVVYFKLCFPARSYRAA